MSESLPQGLRLLPQEQPKQQTMSERLAQAGRTMAGFPFTPIDQTIFGRVMTTPEAKRMAGLTARGLLQGPSSLVGLPFDAMTAAYNLATGQRLRQPSEAINQALTQAGLPEPQGLLETGVTTLAGGFPEARTRLENLLSPAMQRVANTPFMGQQNLQDLATTEAIDAGYVIPPSATGRSMVRENISGKAMTQQEAAARNQEVTNRLAARSLGLPEDRPLSPTAISEVRQKAGKVYEKIKTDRSFSADSDYLNDLIALEENALSIARDFPNLNISGMGEIQNLVKGLTEQNFSAKSLVDLVKKLRFEATANSSFAVTDPAQKALGNAQKDAAEALEALMERQLARQGDTDLAQEFRNARMLIAKSHSVEDALNPATGNINAISLAGELQRRNPLSGELATIARFGLAFPFAAREGIRKPVSAADIVVTSMLAPTLGSLPFFMGAQSPYAALSALGAAGFTGSRIAARGSILGPNVQQSLTRRPQQPSSGLLAPVAGAMTTAGAQSQQPAPNANVVPPGLRVLPEYGYYQSPLSQIVPSPSR